jgi:hypothetical protein
MIKLRGFCNDEITRVIFCDEVVEKREKKNHILGESWWVEFEF